MHRTERQAPRDPSLATGFLATASLLALISGALATVVGLGLHYARNIRELWLKCLDATPSSVPYAGEVPEFTEATTWLPLGHTCAYAIPGDQPLVVASADWDLTVLTLLGLAAIVASVWLFLAARSRVKRTRRDR